MLTKDTPPAPPGEPEPDASGVVKVIGILTTVAGAITWFSAYSGVDDWRQITVGIVITGFGITWWILSYVLRTSQRP